MKTWISQTIFIAHFAFSSVTRYHKRTLPIAIATAFGMILLELYSGYINGVRNDFLKDIKHTTGDIQIRHQEMVQSKDLLIPVQYPVPQVQSIIDHLMDDPRITQINTFVDFPAYLISNPIEISRTIGTEISSNTDADEEKYQTPILITGIELDKPEIMERVRSSILLNPLSNPLTRKDDETYATLASLFKNPEQSGRFVEYPGELVVGYRLGLMMGIQVGDEVHLLVLQEDSSVYYQNFILTGFFKTNILQEEQGLGIIGIQDAQKMLGYNNKVSYLSIITNTSGYTASVCQDIQHRIDFQIKPTTEERLPVRIQPGVLLHSDLDSNDTPLKSVMAIYVPPPSELSSIPETSAFSEVYSLFKQHMPQEKDDQDTPILGFMLVDSPFQNHTRIDTQAPNTLIAMNDVGYSQDTVVCIPFASPHLNLPTETLFLMSPDPHQDANPDSLSSQDSLEQMAAMESIVMSLKEKGINLEEALKKSQSLIDAYSDTLQNLARIEMPAPLVCQTWDVYNSTLSSILHLQDDSYYYIYIIILIITASIIINTVLVGVFDRTKDLGTLRSIGWSKFHIFSLIEWEAFYFGAVGSGIGVGIGMLIVIIWGQFGFNLGSSADMIPGMSCIIYPSVNLLNSLGSFCLGILLVMVVSIIPASIAMRLPPIKALGFSL